MLLGPMIEVCLEGYSQVHLAGNVTSQSAMLTSTTTPAAMLHLSPHFRESEDNFQEFLVQLVAKQSSCLQFTADIDELAFAQTQSCIH